MRLASPAHLGDTRFEVSNDPFVNRTLTVLGLSLHAKEFAEMIRKEGIAGYMKNVAAPAIASMATDKYGKPTSRGGYLADAFFDVVAGNEITSDN